MPIRLLRGKAIRGDCQRGWRRRARSVKLDRDADDFSAPRARADQACSMVRRRCTAAGRRLHLRRHRRQFGQCQEPRVLRQRDRRPVSAALTSCGVVVGDGERLLLGHATRSPRWDIPKGETEPGEDFAAAAVRELREETGLVVAPEELAALGLHPYRRGKDLVLFAWRPSVMPDPRRLVCASHFVLADGTRLPEFDRFGVFAWDAALARVGKSLARLLSAIGREAILGASK
jgi:8-oxo-dGTP pyrophosphatase MutT (NUDIX family)